MMKYCILKLQVIVSAGETGCVWVVIDVYWYSGLRRRETPHLKKG